MYRALTMHLQKPPVTLKITELKLHFTMPDGLAELLQ